MFTERLKKAVVVLYCKEHQKKQKRFRIREIKKFRTNDAIISALVEVKNVIPRKKQQDCAD